MDESGGDAAGEGGDSSRLHDSWAAAAADARADARGCVPGGVARAPETLRQAHGERHEEEEALSFAEHPASDLMPPGFSFTEHTAYSWPPPASCAAAPGGEEGTEEGSRRRRCGQAAPVLDTHSGGGSLLGHASLASHSDFPESVV